MRAYRRIWGNDRSADVSRSDTRSHLRYARFGLLGGTVAVVALFSLGIDGCQQVNLGAGEVGTATCLACHDGRSASDQQEHLKGAHSGVSCETCHGPGLNHVRNGGRLGLFIENPARLPFEKKHQICAECHGPSQMGSGNAVSGFLASQHFAGAAATCTDCHNVHRIGSMTIPAESPSRLTDEGYAALCGECHEQESKDFLMSTHAVTDSARCNSCHDMHDDDMYPFTLRPENNTLCLQCHQMSLLGFQTDADTDFHTGPFHPVDPAGSGSSRCSGCHMPPLPSMAEQNTASDHTLFTIPPVASNEAILNGADPAPANSCSGVMGCHDPAVPGSGRPRDVNDMDSNDRLQLIYEVIGDRP